MPTPAGPAGLLYGSGACTNKTFWICWSLERWRCLRLQDLLDLLDLLVSAGTSEGRQMWEFLAVLMGLSIWLTPRKQHNISLTVRGDSSCGSPAQHRRSAPESLHRT